MPKKLNSHETDIWTRNAQKVLMNNNFMLSRPFYQNKYFLRSVLGNYNTQESDLLRLSNLLNEI